MQALTVRFDGYEPEVAKKILKERTEKAFKPDVVPEEFLDWLSEFPSKFGDIRVCFNILLTAGLLAEQEGKTRIERDHFIQATKTIQQTI